MSVTTTSAPAIQEWLTKKVASYLPHCVDQIDAVTPLAEFGFDSVYALSLCGDIIDEYHIDVDPTLAWDYPTITAIAGYIAETLGAAERD